MVVNPGKGLSRSTGGRRNSAAGLPQCMVGIRQAWPLGSNGKAGSKPSPRTPRVTTQEKGLGVGLSIPRAIIQTHGGCIWAELNPAGGTVFKLSYRSAKQQELTNGR
jgi:hypothetical protein